MKQPREKYFDGSTLIFIDDVDGFREWLHGQTCPLVEGDPNPFGWAYHDDYLRYINHKPVVD